MKKKSSIVSLAFIGGIIGLVVISNPSKKPTATAQQQTQSVAPKALPIMPETLNQSTAQIIVSAHVSTWPQYIDFYAEDLVSHISAYGDFNKESAKYCIPKSSKTDSFAKSYLMATRFPCFVTNLPDTQAMQYLGKMEADGIVTNYGKVGNRYVFQMQSEGSSHNFKTTKNNVWYGHFPSSRAEGKVDKIIKLTEKRYEVQFVSWQISDNPFYNAMLFKKQLTHKIKVEWDGRKFSVVGT